MQAGDPWLGIGLGAGIGILYVAASYVSNRHALRSEERFLIVVFTAALIRIVAALVMLVGILLLLPVSPTALLGSFFVLFAIGLVVEVWYLHTRGPTSHDAARDR